MTERNPRNRRPQQGQNNSQRSNQQSGGNQPRRNGGRPQPADLPQERMSFDAQGEWQAEPVPGTQTRPPQGRQPERQSNDRRGNDRRGNERNRPQNGERHNPSRQSQAPGQDSRADQNRAPAAPKISATNIDPSEWRKLLGERTPTPVQEHTIPQLIAGHDVVSTARTGSGKTLAFLIPAAVRHIGVKAPTAGMAPEVLIISPTRELAVQIRDVARELGMEAGRITGGITPRETTREGRAKGVISGTPGRLKDLIDKRELDLSYARYLVLDEADELLSLGFLKDVEWIVNQARRQSEGRGLNLQVVLTSATFPDEVRQVAARVLRNPVRIDIEPPAPAARPQNGELAAAGEGQAEHLAADSSKGELLAHAAEEIRGALSAPGGCAVVFCRTKALTKRRAEELGKLLPGETVVGLQGNMDQKKREAVMTMLREGKARVLVATDIAGRGIDLPEVRLVIHADIATTSEEHVHRSGRTARAGRGGRNLVLLIPEQRQRWAQVRRGLPTQLHPPKTAQEHLIDKDIQEKQGRGSGNGVDSGPRQGSDRQRSNRQGSRQGGQRQGQRPSGNGPRRR